MEVILCLLVTILVTVSVNAQNADVFPNDVNPSTNSDSDDEHDAETHVASSEDVAARLER